MSVATQSQAQTQVPPHLAPALMAVQRWMNYHASTPANLRPSHGIELRHQRWYEAVDVFSGYIYSVAWHNGLRHLVPGWYHVEKKRRKNQELVRRVDLSSLDQHALRVIVHAALNGHTTPYVIRLYLLSVPLPG